MATITKTIISNVNKVQFDISIFEVKDKTVNLTKIGQYFGKDVNTWKKSKKVRDFVQKLDEISGCQNLQIRTGDNSSIEQGTFGTEKVALKFAEYISTDFEIWANDKIHTLLQTGKVEIAQSIPANQFDFLRSMLDNLETQSKRVNQLENITVRHGEKLIELETKSTGVVVDISSVKDYKTVRELEKDYLGREINYFVNKKYVELRSLDFQNAHRTAWKDYREDTGFDYAGAKFATKESKQHFLEWLKSL